MRLIIGKTDDLTFEQVVNPSRAFLEAYDKIPMLVHVKSKLDLVKVDRGLGGILFREVAVEPYIKDLGQYEPPSQFAREFDTNDWGFFAAFDRGKAIAAATVAYKTKEIRMLDGRDDLCILWDIRVDDAYKRRGVGSRLFQMATVWAKRQEIPQMKIECQNNNLPAIRFYHKSGAVLGAVDEYFYYNDPDSREEIALIWYLDLRERQPEKMNRDGQKNNRRN